MRVRKTECLKKLELMEKRKGLVVPMPNKKTANRLSAGILNYFAAFTETRFNFRTLINYRWTNNELTLDLAIFQDFQIELILSPGAEKVEVSFPRNLLLINTTAVNYFKFPNVEKIPAT